jgi:hypothetical protein
MKRSKTREISSEDLWGALQKSNPELTAVSESRKTPRTTMMRDLRKDGRFVVGNRRVSLSE